MSSLSRSMASFQIREDDENTFPQLSAKLKELGPIQTKRVALGELSKNVVERPAINVKIGNKSDNSYKENPTKLPIADKPSKNRVDPISKQVETKSCKDVTVGKSTVDNAIDKTALVTITQRVDKKERPPLKDVNILENEKTDDDHSFGGNKKILSPMSIDNSPAVTTGSLPDSIKIQLEDLYACVAYKNSIYRYLKERETLFKPKPYYMKRQPDVGYNMRTILVDWLVEVGEEYKLSHQTLFLSVNYVDRFLSYMAVVRGKLQLLGAAAMFLAAKFEEIYPPEVGEFTYITDNTYTKNQVLRMENLILKVLDFNVSTPTSYTFIMHISASTQLPDKVMFLAMYICELSLLEADPYLDCLPSEIACGAIAIARHCLGYVDVWPSYLSSSTSYTLKRLARVIQYLNATHLNSSTSTHVAVSDKYRSNKYLSVSRIPHKKLSIRLES